MHILLRMTMICGLAIAAMDASAQDFRTGRDITVSSDWSAKNGWPENLRVVRCKARSRLCLRAGKGGPGKIPVARTNQGLRANFADIGVTYQFQPGGTGIFFDERDNQIGNFSWTQ